jgi:hypothetical protein
MRNSFLFITALILTTLLFSGCKKYDEGPKFITLRSVKNRLTNGDWALQELITNGTNVTDSYKEIDFSYSFVASSGLDAKQYTYSQSYTYLGQLVKVSGYIVFLEDDNMRLELDYEYLYNTGYYPDFFSYDNNNNGIVWTIKKLTNKELWMEAMVDGVPTSMKLTKEK